MLALISISSCPFCISSEQIVAKETHIEIEKFY